MVMLVERKSTLHTGHVVNEKTRSLEQQLQSVDGNVPQESPTSIGNPQPTWRIAMFDKLDYAMVNVSDMDRSVAFYRDTLGIALKFESPGWSEFQTGTTTLALHLSPAADHQHGRSGPTAGNCSLGFSVGDLDKTYAELQARGARFVMPPMDQLEEGIRHAVCMDPDGLGISFAQSIAHHG